MKNRGLITLSFIIVFLGLAGISVSSYSNLQGYGESIDYSCQIDSDCVIKDVHNCCGYYPRCTNKNAVINITFVTENCKVAGIGGVCGYSTIDYCKCENNFCSSYQNNINGDICVAGECKNNNISDCKNLYWFDTSHDICGQKQFCGAYMYYGLQTFESKEECEIALNGNLDRTNCNYYYWFDNENKECGQKEFCGMYMYYGLQTFETKTQCEMALNKSCTCPEDAKICPDGHSVGRTCPKCEFEPCVRVDCDYEEEGKCYKILSNGRKAEIKIMPEAASEIAISRLGELGFSIVFREIGIGNKIRIAYHFEAEKEGRMLGLFKVKGKVSADIDAETGEVISASKPWWAFMASRI